MEHMVHGQPQPGERVMVGVGDPLPDLGLRDQDSRPWTIAQHLGRPVVLVLHRHLA